MAANNAVRTIVTPGEIVSLAPTSSSSNKVRLGAGLRQDRLVARSVKAGTLAVDHKGRHWVDNKQKRVSSINLCFLIVFCACSIAFILITPNNHSYVHLFYWDVVPRR